MNIGLNLIGRRILPKSVQLAVTAALEHYTATLAEVLLTDERAQAWFSVPEVRSLLMWHALEESEHKAVAFDVYQAVCGDQRLRAWVMNVTSAFFIGTVVLETFVSLLTDRSAYNLPRLVRSILALRTNPWLSKKVRDQIRDYNRRDFHPDDHGSADLVDTWAERFFGPGGTLVEKVRSGASL